MFHQFRGIKRYNNSWEKRLPSATLKGLFHDVKLHLRSFTSDQRHIFVVGAPRSGTTLVRGIIAGHSAITTSDKETFFFCRRRTSLFRLAEVPDVEHIVRNSKSKTEAFDNIAKFFKERDKVDIFLEKTPEHALFVDKLISWYPNSHIVFVVRDGRDAYSSSFRNTGFHKRSGKFYAELWRDVARVFIRNKDAPQIIPIYYEQFVNEPLATTERLMASLGLEFEGIQLDPKTISNTSFAKRKGHEKLNEDIDARSVGIYRNRLTSAQIKHFENVALEELFALGYLDEGSL